MTDMDTLAAKVTSLRKQARLVADELSMLLYRVEFTCFLAKRAGR